MLPYLEIIVQENPIQSQREPILKRKDIRCKSVLYYWLYAVYKNQKIIYVFLKMKVGK